MSKRAEEAAEIYCVEICNYAVDSLEADTAIDAFIEGAKWQKEQECSVQASYEAEIEKAEERGFHLCKEQMLKDVVEGMITCVNLNRYILVPKLDESLTYGHKVKIVIVPDKEDEK